MVCLFEFSMTFGGGCLLSVLEWIGKTNELPSAAKMVFLKSIKPITWLLLTPLQRVLFLVGLVETPLIPQEKLKSKDPTQQHSVAFCSPAKSFTLSV